MKKILLSLVLLVLTVGVAVSCKPPKVDEEVIDYQKIVNAAVEKDLISYASGDTRTSVTKDVTLVTSVSVTEKEVEYSVSISWTTSNAAVVSTSGAVVRDIYEDKNVNLTATAQKEGKVASKTTSVVVVAPTYSINLNNALILNSGDTLQNVTHSVTLRDRLTLVGYQANYDVTWETSNPAVITKTGIVHRPLGDDVNVTLTASATYGNQTESKAWILTVKGLTDPWADIYAALNEMFEVTNFSDLLPSLTQATSIILDDSVWVSDSFVYIAIPLSNPSSLIAGYITLFANNPNLTFLGYDSYGDPVFAYNIDEDVAIYFNPYVNGGATYIVVGIWLDDAFVENEAGTWAELYVTLEDLLGISVEGILPEYETEVFVDGNYLPDIFVDIITDDPDAGVVVYQGLLETAGFVYYADLFGSSAYVWDLGDGTGLFVIPWEYNGYLELYVYIDAYDPNVGYDPWVNAYATLDEIFEGIFDDTSEYLPKLDEATAVAVVETYISYGVVIVNITVDDPEGTIEAYQALFDANPNLTAIGLQPGLWIGDPETLTWVVNHPDGFGVYFQVILYDGVIEVDIYLDDPWVGDVEGLTWAEVYEALVDILGLDSIDELLPEYGDEVLLYNFSTVYLDIESVDVAADVVAYNALLSGAGYVLVDPENNVWVLDLGDGTGLYVAAYDYNGAFELAVWVEEIETPSPLFDQAKTGVNTYLGGDYSDLFPWIEEGASAAQGIADNGNYYVVITPVGTAADYFQSVVAAFDADPNWISYGVDPSDNSPIYYQEYPDHPDQAIYVNPYQTTGGDIAYFIHIGTIPAEINGFQDVIDRLNTIFGVDYFGSILLEYTANVGYVLDESYGSTIYLDFSVATTAAAELPAYVAQLQANANLIYVGVSSGQYTFQSVVTINSYSAINIVAMVYGGVLEVAILVRAITYGVSNLIRGYNSMSYFYGVDLTSVLPNITTGPLPTATALASEPSSGLYQVTYTIGTATNRNTFITNFTTGMNSNPAWHFIFNDSSDGTPYWYYNTGYSELNGGDVWVLLNIYGGGTGSNRTAILYVQYVLGLDVITDFAPVWAAYDALTVASGFQISSVFTTPIVGTYYLKETTGITSYPYVVTASGAIRYDYYDPFTTLSAQLIADLVAYGFTVSTGSGNNVTYSITEGGYVITFHLVYNINSTGSYFEVKVTPAA